MSDYSLPDDCGYNKIYQHQWRTTQYALPMSSTYAISNLVNGKWGWHFLPHKNMDYSRENWFEDQTLVISFEDKMDLILCKLLVDIT